VPLPNLGMWAGIFAMRLSPARVFALEVAPTGDLPITNLESSIHVHLPTLGLNVITNTLLLVAAIEGRSFLCTAIFIDPG
jgi:hypothetical protein